ncbi:MAG: 3-isopropylmalate dehydratase small subunit [Chloroflexi bacterium]|nr:3-isopropylmalate dehydratase small subunit [Chloroflexota bacterium]
MEPYSTHTGVVAPLPRVNVDTDQIIPKQFLKRIERTGFGGFAFFDWRYLPDGKPNPEFELNRPSYEGASILVARRNFGCGSSREHAVWALLEYGFSTIIAPSFADIFFNNCIQNGVLPVVLPEEQVEELLRKAEDRPGYRLSVNLRTQMLYDTNGFEVPFDIDPFVKERLLHGLDDIAFTLKQEDRITAFERERPRWLTPSDRT